MRTVDQLGAAVLIYANLGHRVLPLHHPVSTNANRGRGMRCSCGDPACGAIGKHPLTPHGLKDATSDPAQLGRWWRRWPQANIGLVTGEVADVLDIDGPAGRAALRRFAADHDLRLDGPVVQTGSGWHVYLAPTGSGNRAGLLEQVDWRGRGGYVVAPPSRHARGRRYRWLRPLTAELPAAPVPLRRLLDPARAQPSRPVPAAPFRPTPAGHPYGRTALKQELSAVAHAPKGRRNHTLYLAGIRLYSLVAGGVLTRDEVETGLLTAAETSRLLVEEPAQTRRTLASAERTGLTHPRGVPALTQSSHPAPGRRSSRQARGHEDRERAEPTQPRSTHRPRAPDRRRRHIQAAMWTVEHPRWTTYQATGPRAANIWLLSRTWVGRAGSRRRPPAAAASPSDNARGWLGRGGRTRRRRSRHAVGKVLGATHRRDGLHDIGLGLRGPMLCVAVLGGLCSRQPQANGLPPALLGQAACPACGGDL